MWSLTSPRATRASALENFRSEPLGPVSETAPNLAQATRAVGIEAVLRRCQLSGTCSFASLGRTCSRHALASGPHVTADRTIDRFKTRGETPIIALLSALLPYAA